MATTLWTWQGGTESDDRVTAVVSGADNSIILAGYTSGDWGGVNAGGLDMVAFKLSPGGNLLWKWQGGTDGNDVAYAAAIGADGSVVMAGLVDGDFGAVKLGSIGDLQWQWQNGTDSVEWMSAVGVGEDGSVVLAGTTSGDWARSNAGSRDWAACKLTTDGELLWRYQETVSQFMTVILLMPASHVQPFVEDQSIRVSETEVTRKTGLIVLQIGKIGTRDFESATALIVSGDDEILLAGSLSLEWDDSGSYNTDFAAVKLDSDGNELWDFKNGTLMYAELAYAGLLLNGGSALIAGATRGNWSGLHAGGDDFAAVVLDGDGLELWKWQDGTSEYDAIKDASGGDDESIHMAGETEGSWHGSNVGGFDFAAVTLSPDGVELSRWQGGSTGDDRLTGVTSGSDGRFVLGGYTSGSWGDDNEGGDDFVAIMFGAVTPLPTPAPTTAEDTTLVSHPQIGLIAGVITAVVAMALVVVVCMRSKKVPGVCSAANDAPVVPYTEGSGKYIRPSD